MTQDAPLGEARLVELDERIHHARQSASALLDSGGGAGDDGAGRGAGKEVVADDDKRTRRLQLLTTTLPRAGSALSLVIIAGGVILSVIRDPVDVATLRAVPEGTELGGSFPHTVPDVVRGLGDGQGPAVVMTGLLLLIATPVVRVVGIVATFAYRRDRAYAAVATVVLVLLLLSFAIGRAGG